MIVTLSGWGQPHNALHDVAPGALAIDYARHTSAQAALLDMAAQAKDASTIIGWSLGGQLAVRAIASGLLKPKKLVLIAAPFQFVAHPPSCLPPQAGGLGMPADLYQIFRDNYAANPERTLVKAWATIVKGDTKAHDIRRHLERQDKSVLISKPWLAWLDVLHSFSCSDLTFADFPPTLLIHGREDAVVYHAQSEKFTAAIQGAKLVTLEGCGHAPQWHSTALIQQLISDFTHV